jgi:flagellar biosynthetic protein FliR
MSALYPSHWMEYLNVAQIFLRLMGFFVLMPAFSNDIVPGKAKLLIGLSLSLALYPILHRWLPPIPETLEGLAALALRETAVGLIMGLAGYITFEGISLSGQFLSTQMGFGAAGMIDPMNHTQTSSLVVLEGWLVLMVFFFTDMHHVVLGMFVSSFEVTARLGEIDFTNQLMMNEFMRISAKLFMLAVQMAAPFTLLMLTTNLAIGVLSRLLPQLNIILFSFPITITLGFLSLYLLAPDLLNYLENVLGNMTADIAGVLKVL